ncbi:sensor histidine kinase [Paenibacillus piri]|uniref:histidine kinase n=1 Tax=Paenibacillus piri TaxID=2547395 RepID=A0A4R5KH92_9BACL|nr:HAMP domain-containing sensor histidine kinase [Paenibacillus piri]TDF94696.1 HAMP domain-containing histidine kinase [Paenibacillus piri]
MQTHLIRRQTLLSRWTFRYVLTLFLGLFIIGLVSIFWIRQETINERKHSLQEFSQAAARYVTDGHNNIVIPGDFYEWIDHTQREYFIPGQFALIVFDRGGTPVFVKKAPPRPPGRSSPNIDSKPELTDRLRTARIGDDFILMAPMMDYHSPIGSVVIAYSYDELTNVNHNYILTISLLFCAGLLGWTIIYFLSRNLRKPIIQLSEALYKIKSGDYNVTVPVNVKEKEVHDLLLSFKTMASRLAQLEELRTELLAGVSHELKTPVASIHGLIRAVRDQVVTEGEAEEFLDISLEQTRRLQHMVTDLLDFNSFASGIIKVRQDSIDFGKLLSEIVYQWGQLYQEEGIEITVDIPNRTFMCMGDASRTQQIVVNLLNNSKQAFQGRGHIGITLSEYTDQTYEVIVRDDGPGIPEAEQAHIFEKYFRGERKKLSVSGLGLGLTYSRMLAVAMKGQLNLINSSPQGTAFQLLLPKQH